MSGSREAILARVREALRTPSDPHVRRSHDARALPIAPTEEETRRWLPAVGELLGERVELFRQLSQQLRTNFVQVADEAAAAAAVAQIAVAEAWRSVGVHRHPLVETALAQSSVERLVVDDGYDPQQLERCDAGVTGCDALIAQSGSVLVTTRSAGGRVLSVLPPHHVVVARAEQLLPDLPAAFALLSDRYGGDWPSFMSLITGPSRTGDIERILVLGAHGPKRLTVILAGR